MMEGPAEDAVQQKEREWREALNAKCEETNGKLRQRDVMIGQQKEKLELLQRDFHYNLGLLLDRDAELVRYEAAIKDLNAAVKEKTSAIHELKMKLDDTQLLTRRQFMEAEDVRRLYEKRMSEKDAAILEGKRQLESALEKLNTETENYRRQMLKRDSDIQRLSRELHTEHTTAICRRDAQHSTDVADLNSRLQREQERSKSLECELQASQCKAIKLQTEITDIQIRAKEAETSYRNQLGDFRLAIQGREDALNGTTSKLREAEKKLADKEAELKDIRTEKDQNMTKYSGQDEEFKRIMQELGEALNAIEDFKQTIKELNENIEVMKSENMLEQEKMKCKVTSSTNNEIEIDQLKNQNQVLKQIIKDLKRKMILSVESCRVGTIEESSTVDSRNVEGDNPEQQKKKRDDCKECRKMRNIHEYHHLEVEEELKELRLKVDQLSLAVNVNENEDEKRIQQLENTIGLLKTQMLHGLRDKLQNKVGRGGGGGDNKKITFGDVRIMLLEQKLDRATENIGKAVTSEKQALMEEMQSVRKELVSKLEEAKNKSLQCSAEKREKLKSDEMFEKVRNEILKLERKFDRLDKSCGEGHQNRSRNNDGNSGCNDLTLPLIHQYNSPTRQTSVARRLEAHPRTDKENNNAQEQHTLLSASTNDSTVERVLELIPEESSKESSLSRMRPTVKPVVIHPHPNLRSQQVTVTPKPNPKPLKLRVRNYNVKDPE